MDGEADMMRGIAQVLYNFGPGNVFDYGEYDVAMRVKDKGVKVRQFNDLPVARVTGEMRSQADRFRNADESPWNELSPADLDAYRPRKVEGRLFPLTMVCDQPECRRVDIRQNPTDYYATDSEDKNPGDCPRDGCQGRLQQVPFVVTHECGNALPPGPTDECETHDYVAPYLHKPTRDPATWRFRCDYCGDDMGPLGAFCEDCNEYVGGPTPPGGGGIYYPATLLQVAIPPVGMDRDDLEREESWARVLMAAFTDDDVPLTEDNTIEDMVTRAGEQEQIENLREEGYTEDEIERYLQMQADAGRAVDHLTSEYVTEKTRGEIDPPGTEGDDETREQRAYSLIADQLFTFIRSTEGYEGDPEHDDYDPSTYPEPRKLSDVLTPEFKERYPRARKYQDKLDRINVNEVWVVDNFPLLSVLYGYYRELPDPSQVDLNAFDHPYGDEGTIPVFADRSPSEALILEVDRKALVKWLVDANVVDESVTPDADASDETYQKWLLNNVDPVAVDNPFSDVDHEPTESAYRLLHSMSHALVSTASDQCGLATDSISELILPNVPAIILYAKSTEHFALGGMSTLFETRIHPWVDHTIDFAEQCLLDPACSQDDDGAACHACLHLTTVTCEAFNEHLDRRALVGGPATPAFWNV